MRGSPIAGGWAFLRSCHGRSFLPVQREGDAGLGSRLDNSKTRSPRRLTGSGRLGAIYVPLIAANLIAWLWAWHAFSGQPTLLGTALLAWVFGLRHAVDADHIAAIDNVVRKLMREGQRPVTSGLYFSLGHSTIVVLGSLGIAATTAAMQDRLETFKAIGGMLGTTVSAVFLLLIALVNLVILRDVWRGFHHVARGGAPDAADALDTGGGLLARLCRPLFRTVTRSWHMYPVGFLFALGFDTATEVGVVGIAAAQAARGMSAWDTLIFPALFTAGMALVDTTDSVLMVGAYGWAFVRPLRKLWYNLTITAISVLVALLIGGIEAVSLLAGHFGFSGGIWSFIAGLNDDMTRFGFAVVGLFALAWGLSAIVYRWKGYDRLMPSATNEPQGRALIPDRTQTLNVT
jgi:high-affinity nickel-transport protein